MPRDSPWVQRPRPNDNAALRLLCFPYVGGGATIFRTWPERLPAAVEVCAVQLPGRGSRLRERPFADLADLTRALSTELSSLFTRPVAVFGHSMGALIGFELVRQLRRQGGAPPRHLFVSAAPAPHLGTTTHMHELSEGDFIRELRDMNGTPESLLENQEFIQLMLPALRADFSLLETYRYAHEPALPFPITAFGATRDRIVTVDQLSEWSHHTSSRFTKHVLAGDHFFINGEPKLTQLLSDELSQILTQMS